MLLQIVTQQTLRTAKRRVVIRSMESFFRVRQEKSWKLQRRVELVEAGTEPTRFLLPAEVGGNM